MERTLSPEEKIRRAEEIYARRRSGYSSNKVATVNVSEEKNFSLFKKMILQIAICLLIYFIFYLIQNSNYVFSEDVINKTKEILSYDIDIPGMCSSVINGFNEWSEGIVPNTINENMNNAVEENNIINTIEENAMGGAELENVVMENVTVAENEIQNEEQEKNEQENSETTENQSQEIEKEEEKQEIQQTDDEYIKSNFSFIKPIEGVVSSEFGIRDVDNPIVSKNHTGIDIAANTGTVIRASMEGTVTVSSTIGDYGYHIKITNGDVSTLYAHCSKLYVNVGDQITQGQEIAEVGSTGNSTGPHLHFEIMRGTTYINPRNILEF